MLNLLQPKPVLDEQDVQRGLRMLLFDGVFSQTMGSFVTGAFLVAFALKLGASNSVVGLLAAIGPLTQSIQIPGIFLVNRLRLRKGLTVLATSTSRLFLIPAALVPFLFSETYRIPVLIACLFVFYGMMAIASCAFNSWVRDLVPQQIFGQFFARRMSWAVATGAALSLAASVGVDYYHAHVSDGPEVYTLLFLLGASAGFLGVTTLMRTPEPLMAPPEQQRILHVLREPFADLNFRKLLIFLGSWNFAVNIATPFGAVYMLERLDMSLTAVLLMVVFGQAIHVVFLRIWGRLIDRYSNKSVLTISGPLFMLSFLVWPFTTMPESYALTMPLLVFAHALSGMSTAGVALASSNIALKSAPYGRATAYLAVNALVCGTAMTISPILAGLAADFLEQRELSLTFHITDLAARGTEFSVVALNLRGLDFLFVAASLLGLYAVHRLLVVQEEGEVQERVVVEELWNEVRKFGRSVSTFPGLRNFAYFPFYLLSAGGEPVRARDQQEPMAETSPPTRGPQ